MAESLGRSTSNQSIDFAFIHTSHGQWAGCITTTVKCCETEANRLQHRKVYSSQSISSIQYYRLLWKGNYKTPHYQEWWNGDSTNLHTHHQEFPNTSNDKWTRIEIERYFSIFSDCYHKEGRKIRHFKLTSKITETVFTDFDWFQFWAVHNMERFWLIDCFLPIPVCRL